MAELPSTPNPKNAFASKHAWLVAAAVFVALSIRMFAFINRYAVNILFMDQWDFYGPLFQGEGLWAAFTHQHGPHRQGIGFLVTEMLAWMSGWNSRWDAFAIGAALVLACGLGFSLARKCGVSGWPLTVLPFLFLNIRQYEMFVHASNLSHGAMPLVLIMGLALSLFISNCWLKAAAATGLTFLGIFTGFAIFTGVVMPLVLVVELAHAWRSKNRRDAIASLIALAGIAAAWWLFSVGYRFDPAVDGYRFPYEKPQEYLYFTAAMFNNFHGLKTENILSLAFGLGVTCLVVFLMIQHGWRFLRKKGGGPATDAAIFFLAAFTLVYCANTAIGRVFNDWRHAAAASRYVTLMVPAGMACLLHFARIRLTRIQLLPLAAYLLLLVYGSTVLRSRDRGMIDATSKGRLAWKRVFLETRNQDTANVRTRFQVYLVPISEEKMRYLEERHLNLFNPGAEP